MRISWKYLFLSLLVLLIMIGQVIMGQSQIVKADDDDQDLILLENVPQVPAEFSNQMVQLSALRIYEEGPFMLTSDNLEWSSTNTNVATVNEDGMVSLTGKKGQAVIIVTDGKGKDHIKVGYNDKGKSTDEPYIQKRNGNQYEIIEDAIEDMSIKEKLGQMMMPDFRKMNGEYVTEMLPEIELLIDEYHLGGVILFRENVVTTEQTARLVAAYKEATDTFAPLLTIDQEGGIVTRLQSGTDMSGNMALGATRSETLSWDVGRVIGEELGSLGINMNFAPVLDVNNNPDNPVIGVRSFGEDPQVVADLGVAYTKGLQSTGVAATAKHFPGHGDTAVDSHLGLPEVPHDKERLNQVELYPFQQAMEAGIDAIMTAHVTFPKIDDTKVISKKDGTEVSLPATLSHKVLTGLMREEMGYEGVVITDALNMAAIQEHFGTVDAAIRAVQAGADIVLMPVGLEEVAVGLEEAVENDVISEDRIDDAVERILTLKVKRGIIKEENPQPLDKKIEVAEEVVGSQEHRQVEQSVAEQSITLVKNDDVLPFNVSGDEEIVVVGRSFIRDLGEAVSKHHPNTELIRTPSNYQLTQEQLEQIRKADRVIVGTYSYNVYTRTTDHPQMRMVQQIMAETKGPVVGVGIRNPYDIMAYPEIDAYIAQYGFRDASFEATAATMFGLNTPAGKLPVTIPGYDGSVLYDFGHGLSY